MKLWQSILAGGLLVVAQNTIVAASDWLFLVYVASNNNLYPYAQLNMRQLQTCGSNNNAKVIMQITQPGGSTSRYYICKNCSRRLVYQGKVNSSNKKSLSDFLIYGMRNFPARKIFVDVWDHASGYVNSGDFALDRSICYDQTYRTWMRSVDLRDALRTAYQSTHRKIDILGYDACLMQMIEVGAMVAPYATIMVGSEETIPDDGFNYTAMLRPFRTGTLSSVNFAKRLVSDYYAFYKNGSESVTLSAVNLSKMLLLERNVNTVATLLKRCLSHQVGSSVSTTLQNSLYSNTCLHFSLYSYIDLGRWYQTVIANLSDFDVTDPSIVTSLETALRAGLVLLHNAIISTTAINEDSRAMGLSICFPYYVLYPSYANSPFASSNQWVSFIRQYLASRSRVDDLARAMMLRQRYFLRKQRALLK